MDADRLQSVKRIVIFITCNYCGKWPQKLSFWFKSSLTNDTVTCHIRDLFLVNAVRSSYSVGAYRYRSSSVTRVDYTQYFTVWATGQCSGPNSAKCPLQRLALLIGGFVKPSAWIYLAGTRYSSLKLSNFELRRSCDSLLALLYLACNCLFLTRYSP